MASKDILHFAPLIPNVDIVLVLLLPVEGRPLCSNLETTAFYTGINRSVELKPRTNTGHTSPRVTLENS